MSGSQYLSSSSSGFPRATAPSAGVTKPRSIDTSVKCLWGFETVFIAVSTVGSPSMCHSPSLLW